MPARSAIAASLQANAQRARLPGTTRRGATPGEVLGDGSGYGGATGSPPGSASGPSTLSNTIAPPSPTTANIPSSATNAFIDDDV
jgi:hypothetical protein